MEKAGGGGGFFFFYYFLFCSESGNNSRWRGASFDWKRSWEFFYHFEKDLIFTNEKSTDRNLFAKSPIGRSDLGYSLTTAAIENLQKEPFLSKRIHSRANFKAFYN